jgi:integrase
MRMHAARYTARTEFYLGDIRATQQLLGHEDIGTTANIYVQPNEASLERKLSEAYEKDDADMIPPASTDAQPFLPPKHD